METDEGSVSEFLSVSPNVSPTDTTGNDEYGSVRFFDGDDAVLCPLEFEFVSRFGDLGFFTATKGQRRKNQTRKHWEYLFSVPWQ